ncbi:GNAT family N-acetyltransferase [Nocardioides sp.]|uniref:GNAT family N-acetyltransferase n=1 Tax=Nocardioides sp. TaxID=35761 RepID=UPI001A2F34B4|nr:GNAT family N-acetyltransferase [Nocardioides sp.]MBJ7359988.1 GNAT family N-acetyltransferase [Nocardioides sp.]
MAPSFAVRPLRAADLKHIAAIEESGEPQFRAAFGADMHPVLSEPAASGWERDDRPGFILVAAEDGQPPVGFAHVLEIDGHAHLEQLSVRPEAQGQGVGTSLVRAAMREARRDGHRQLSLCTYRDLPFNGPFYATLGFQEVTDPLPFQRQLREHEAAIGLDDDGPRIVMSVALSG